MRFPSTSSQASFTCYENAISCGNIYLYDTSSMLKWYDCVCYYYVHTQASFIASHLTVQIAALGHQSDQPEFNSLPVLNSLIVSACLRWNDIATDGSVVSYPMTHVVLHPPLPCISQAQTSFGTNHSPDIKASPMGEYILTYLWQRWGDAFDGQVAFLRLWMPMLITIQWQANEKPSDGPVTTRWQPIDSQGCFQHPIDIHHAYKTLCSIVVVCWLLHPLIDNWAMKHDFVLYIAPQVLHLSSQVRLGHPDS